MTSEERKYKIFKIFYQGDIDENTIALQKIITKNRFVNSGDFNAMNEGILAGTSSYLIRKNRNKYSKIMYDYNILLEKMSSLSKELNIANSLELNIFFSYLLWNGYLSKDREYNFKKEDKDKIMGLFFLDIMDGFGVCLDNSEMLKDFLNLNGYPSAVLQNFYDGKNLKVNYEVDIERKTITDSTKKKLIERILRKNANHAFNLIEDNGSLYIYDVTNLLLQSIISPYSSEIVNGKGKFKIFPYRSYMSCANPQEIALLDKFIKAEDYPIKYTREDLISISEVNLELLSCYHTLIDDFYAEVRPVIVGISNEVHKIKARTK